MECYRDVSAVLNGLLATTVCVVKATTDPFAVLNGLLATELLVLSL